MEALAEGLMAVLYWFGDRVVVWVAAAIMAAIVFWPGKDSAATE